LATWESFDQVRNKFTFFADSTHSRGPSLFQLCWKVTDTPSSRRQRKDSELKRDVSQWLHSPPISLRWMVFVTLFWGSLLIAWQSSQLARDVEARLEAPFLFAVRDKLGMSPQLDSRIRTLGFDDRTLQYLGRPRLKYEEWANILESIDARGPRAIIIDALFSVTENVHDSSDPGVQSFVSRLSKLKAPVIAGAYATHVPIKGRVALPLDDTSYQLAHYLGRTAHHNGAVVDALPLGDKRGFTVYGPVPSLRAAFRRTGHIHYGQQEGRYLPFLRLNDRQVLPYVMLQALGDVSFVQGRLMVEGSEVPVSSDGSAIINYPSRLDFTSKVYSIRGFIDAKSLPSALSAIQPGDFIYIMPLYFTGNTDFKPSPLGLIATGLHHLAVLNSLITQKHLRSIEAAPFLIVIFACIAALLAWYLQPAAMGVSLLVTFLLWTGACIGGFVSLGWVFPWLTPSLSLLGVGLTLLVHRAREADRKSQYIRLALEGAVQPQVLTELQQHPEKLSLEARERVVSIMFVDIVGFSLMVENQLPRLAFESLRLLIESITRVVHDHGGVVNKTLGDGLLCFFGYSFEDDRERSDHAQQAIQAAIEIQTLNIPRMLAAAQNREPVFPLRIGINTAAVFMGNLGSGQRIDFTVIGNGVNFAKRLEGACLAHCILVGPTTKELVEPFGHLTRARRRMVSIKHYNDMVEAWEYDPFEDQPSLREQADEAYRSTAHLTRLERRWTVARTGNIIVTTLSGAAHLINFSSTGMSFALQTSLPRGKHLEIQIDSLDGQLRQQLSAVGMQRILVEVRWVQKQDDRFLHGVRYLELDARQTEIITDLLCQYGLEDQRQARSQDAS
jgi:class 3 adenylate cyclase